ncbi:hypothetical protein A2926_01520 [Candidatus Giovannonibacteria bacterium RIFCSPLOWO2_01_FULL_44_40]|uniref:Peptidoglycan binding-like domain-containing protein n=1 Tax=Candidatus Giovannonibacteria bacterium RIFCSPHIGHO2_01_FULL_45_23 TaxID=1798325 RepID=A0A1F5VF05_9BACT|nr:MAG: hypothetical protein A2834_01710 [Candidatus Giovannonibacteria bacterium RIFCSPHIGHO2_01_FULL_45_23]OGF79673.1 MAG: hypothetical protein A2926_01520 [Candidatus Giovannonibacteria bacterium RIFCSPLOWO2_01_FULL_44_40]
MNYKTKLTSVMLSVTTAVLLTGSSAVPLVANAALTEAQIQSILSLLQSFGSDQTTINNVNSSLRGLPTSGATTVSAGACSFSRDLTMGAKGDDVTCLQNYLTSTGHYSYSGGATGYFGSVTKNAAAAWQAANGVSPAAGYFGSLSRAKYSSVAGGVVSTPTTPGATPVTPTVVPAVTGTLRVEAGVHPNASLMPINSTRVPFTVVKFTAPANQDVTVNSLVIERTGLASDSAFSGVVLLDETGTQLGIAKTLNSLHQATLTEAFVVKAGQTRIMTIGGNAETSNQSLAGQVAYLSLKQVNSSAASVDGTLPIAGAGHTINESLSIGAVTMLRGSLDPGSSQTKRVGEKDYVFSSVKVTAGSNEKIYLKFVRWNQTGSIGSGDLANVKTYVDATAYDTVVSSDGKYYTVTLTDNGGKGVLIDKGFSKEMTIKGDIVGGSGRTVDFDVAKRTDIGLIGENYGYGITPPQTGGTVPTADSANFSSSEDPWYDAAQVTVSVGSLTITAATSIPAQNIAINLANQPLGGFQVEVKGEQISVGRMDFYFMATSTSGTGSTGVAGTAVTNITLVNQDGVIVAGPAEGTVVKNGHGKVRFTDSVTYPVGIGTYSLKGKLSTTFVSNNTFLASTTPSADWATVTGLVTGQSVTPSSSVVTANQMTVKAGSLTISVSSVPIAQTVIAGASQFLFANYILDGTASGEDLRLTNVPLLYAVHTTGTVANASNCKLYDGSTIITSAVNPSAVGSSTSFTFSGTGYTLPKGTSKTLALKCDVASGATGGYVWGLGGDDPDNGAHSNDWTGVSGLTSGQTIAQTANTSVGQVMTASAGGTMTVVLDANSPNYKLVAAGQTGVELARIKFSAANEDIDLKQVALVVSGAASNTPIDLVGRQVTLWDGASQIGTAVFPTGDTATSSQIAVGSFRIPRAGSRVLTVKGDIAAVTSSGPLTASGDLLIVDYDGNNVGLNGIYGTGVASGSTVNGPSGINGSSAASSQGVRIMKAYPTMAYQTLPSTILPAGTTANQKMYRFSVTANNGDIALYKFRFVIGSSTLLATTSLFSLYSYTDAGYSNVDTTFSSTGLLNGGQCFNGIKNTGAGPVASGMIGIHIFMDKGLTAGGCNTATTTYIVSSGVTRYFELRATVANVSSLSTSKDSISAYVAGDSAFPVNSSNLMQQASGVDGDTNDSFIWSPVSTTTNNVVTDLDYTNSYQITGLPAIGMTSVTLQSQ